MGALSFFGVVVVALTGTFALEASVGIVAPLRPPESASWQRMRSASGRSKTSKTTACLMQKVTLLSKLSDRLRTCTTSCRPGGKQKKRTTSLKNPSGPKGCPNGCGKSRCQQVSLQRQKLLKSLLQPQTIVSFVSVLMHCEPCRIQLINSCLRRSLRWLMNTVPPSRKKCLWVDGSSSWTSRPRKRSVRWIRLAHRIENVELSHGPIRPVCLQLSGPSRPQLTRTCVRPRKLPQGGLKRPTCAPAPPDWTSVRMRIHEARADNDVPACWSRWFTLTEGEALDLRDVQGQQRVASVGRGQELRFKRKH